MSCQRELRYRFRKLSTWVYFGGVFLAAVLAILGAGGVLGSGNVMIGDASGKVHLNSPLTIYLLCGFMAYFGMLLVSAVMAGGIARDFEHESYPFFFTRPVTKLAYLGGRFAGSFLTLAFIFAGSGLGILAATSLPVFDQAMIGPFHAGYYLWPYLVSVVPNTFLMGAIFFGLTILFRKLMPVYVAAVVLFLGYLVGTNMLAVIENRTIAALVDPLGMTAGIVTAFRFWTIAEKNTRLMPLEGLFLLNRAAWLSLAAAFLAFAFWRFRFSQFAGGFRIGRTAVLADPASTPPPSPAAPPAAGRFGAPGRLRLFVESVCREFRAVTGNLYFGVILLCGVLFTLTNANNIGRMYDTAVWPVTVSVLENFHGMFVIFIMIILTFFSGEAVWRDRDRRTSQILDAMPVPDWLPVAARLAGLALVQVLLLAVLMATGIAFQTFSGFHRYQPGLYLTDLLAFRLPDYLLLVALTVVVHVLVNNKYLGHFAMIGYYLAISFMSQFGLEHNLYQFSSDPGSRYSDMNGYGGFLPGFVSFKLYWACLAVLLGLLAHLFTVRGTGWSPRERLATARRRFTRPVAVTSIAAAAGFAILGGWIYYNTNVLNSYRSSKENERLTAERERIYKRWQDRPQPKITAADVNVELYPSRQAVSLAGRYLLRNAHATPIDTLLLAIPKEELEIKRMEPDRPHRIVNTDRPHGFLVCALDQPLAPGDSMVLRFDVSCAVRGFRNKGLNTDLAANGMFINNKDYQPSIGYQEEAELQEDKIRKRNGLAPKPRMAPVDDSLARMNTYIGNDGDWVRFSCTVGTDSGQTALAPGYLQREWHDQGRHYFQYAMDCPILNFYSFLSGRWEVRRDDWNGVAITVYHHRAHSYNVDRMIAAVKRSLEYYTANFGPYQHRQVRIIEFPRYQSFAQSFPNTIPYSEAIGFIARVDERKRDEVDYVTWVTAHEVAHQWWAHQVIGGNVQGATLLSEVLAQYSSLQVLRGVYGEAALRKYRRYELDEYLAGRANERKKEVPLSLLENQGYLHYNKGAIVMDALREYAGEARLNALLAAFVRDYRYQRPPFVNSPVFLRRLRDALPDSLRYLVSDLFEDIVIYDNRALSATREQLPDGRWRVTAVIALRKLRADSLGGEAPLPLRDYLPVAALGRGDTVLARRMVPADRDTVTVELETGGEPLKAGIDPEYYLIDKRPEDNLAKCGGGKQAAEKEAPSGGIRIGIGTD
ncbi:MAG: hypothetical protein MUF78_05425 [Candidatus Edwardsbacteria bacterium]|nr:hypothetical protein [Candidatus Edwardsbacteria bacterium]